MSSFVRQFHATIGTFVLYLCTHEYLWLCVYCTAIPGLMYGAEHAPGMLLWEVTGSSCEAISEIVFMCAYTGDTVCVYYMAIPGDCTYIAQCQVSSANDVIFV